MEAAFPCPLERTVASALLLLSTAPPSLSPINNKSMSDDNSESLSVGTTSKSYASMSVISDEGCSSADLPGQRPRTSPPAARCNEMKLKVVIKSRSKNVRISDCRKVSSGKSATVSWGSETSEASSCLSSNTSSISCARSCNASTKLGGGLKKKPVSSAHLRRRTEAIKSILSGSSVSEVRIRELLGDSPDTSKALRMLLKEAVAKRFGAGGRTDPYIYVATLLLLLLAKI